VLGGSGFQQAALADCSTDWSVPACDWSVAGIGALLSAIAVNVSTNTLS
jgi:hypothetical protein